MEIQGVPDFTDPMPFTRELAGTAPQTPGVHVVFDGNGIAIYVGSTGDLRRRLREHVYGNRNTSVLAEQVSDEIHAAATSTTDTDVGEWLGRCTVSWQMSDDAERLKADLVSALRPRFNRRGLDGRTASRQVVPGIRWGSLVRWSARFAESIDLEVVERAFKLEIAGKVVATADALRTGTPEWPVLLRRSFGSPNNLTSHFQHGALLRWVDANPEDAAALLDTLWDYDRDVHDAMDAFCASLPTEVSGSGTRANIASFLLAGRDVTSFPIYRQTVFNKAFDLTRWPNRSDAGRADRYDTALEFLDEYARQCSAAGVNAIRDRLDAQGLLWSVLSGNAPPAWPTDLIEQYMEFLGGSMVDELGRLVAEFRRKTPYPPNGRDDRNQERSDLGAALTLEGLNEPDIGLLRRLAGSAYGGPGAQPGFYKLLQSDAGVDNVTRTFRHLLFGTEDVARRLDDCMSGEYKLPRVGEAMLVKALAVTDPDRWIPCFVSRGPVGKLVILALLGLDIHESAVGGATAVATNDAIRITLSSSSRPIPGECRISPGGYFTANVFPPTSMTTLADDLYLTEEFLDASCELLDDKGQVVFYGPPGTGKTYVARKLADTSPEAAAPSRRFSSIPPTPTRTSSRATDRSSSTGKSPTRSSTDRSNGSPPKRRQRSDVNHVLLIDEMNRGNVAKSSASCSSSWNTAMRRSGSSTPSPLLSATKPEDHRNHEHRRPINRPGRHALRRRFHFVPFFPDLAPIDTTPSPLARRHASRHRLVRRRCRPRQRLPADRNLAIGPSHFMRPDLTDELIRLAWESSVLPFLEEHFFSDPDQLRQFDLDRLRHRNHSIAAIPCRSRGTTICRKTRGDAPTDCRLTEYVPSRSRRTVDRRARRLCGRLVPGSQNRAAPGSTRHLHSYQWLLGRRRPRRETSPSSYARKSASRRCCSCVSYALDPEAWRKPTRDSGTPTCNLAEAIVPLFAQTTQLALRPGLLHGYRTTSRHPVHRPRPGTDG